MSGAFEKIGLLTARAAMDDHYSIELHRSVGCSLSLPHRRWHVVSFYPFQTQVERTGQHGVSKQWQAGGHVGVYPAGVGERISWFDSCEALHLHIDPLQIRDDYDCVVWPSRRDPSRNTLLRGAAAALYEEVQAYSKLGRSRIKELVTLICSMLAADGAALRANPEPSIGKMAMPSILDLMHGPSAAASTISSLAQRSGVSEAHFSRRFRSQFGCSPHDYLITSRVELAKHAVFTGASSLKDIALFCGFYDQAHLANTFRERVGLSITEYRAYFDR